MKLVSYPTGGYPRFGALKILISSAASIEQISFQFNIFPIRVCNIHGWSINFPTFGLVLLAHPDVFSHHFKNPPLMLQCLAYANRLLSVDTRNLGRNYIPQREFTKSLASGFVAIQGH